MTLITLLQSVLLGCNISYSSLRVSHHRQAQRHTLGDQRTAHYDLELLMVSKITSGGKGIYLKEVLILTNTVLLEELDRLITM